MAFKILENINNESEPVITRKLVSEVRVYNCRDFKGKISSVSGIQTPYMYVPKIDQLTGLVLSPTIKIICGEECIGGCKNL